MHNQKFIMPFIDFVNAHFNQNTQLFVIVGGPSESEYPIIRYDNVLVLDRAVLRYWNILKYFKILNNILLKSDRIVLHSLYFPKIIQFLFLNQNFLKKCYWIMWGGDFYFPDKQGIIKKYIIKNIKYLVTYNTGDYELAKKWYKAKGKRIKCFNYPSNLYKEYNIKEKEHTTINVQLGNSADPLNNHLNVLEKLYKYKDENIKIYTPLSYGNQKYAKDVILKGKEYFGDKFIPLMEFMSFEKYLEFLSNIDIAIFAHKRQQAFGNTISLLGLGKKVYLSKLSNINGLMKSLNIKVYNTDTINLSLINERIKRKNIQNVKNNFSKQKLITSLRQYL